MSVPKSLEFGGTDEELEKYLLEFARLTGGWAARNPKNRSWILSGGALLSTNPNTAGWRAEIVRRDCDVSFHSGIRGLPWTRAKRERIAAFRQDQLADYLVARARGSGPEKFDAARLASPFSPWGSGVAAITMSFAWTLASVLAAIALAVGAATLASLPLMNLSIREVTDRAAWIPLPLPPPVETASIGWGFRLGAAFIFAFPLAFFAGLVQSAGLVAADFGRRAARLPQASFLFLACLIALAFFPFTPLSALPAALLVPFAAHAGYTLVWGRRRERVREGPRPRKAVIVVGILLAASLAGLMAPPMAEGDAFTSRIALFRDRFMLGHAPGRSAAALYYRHTLYAANPLKEFYSVDKNRDTRSHRIAVGPVASPAAAVLRSLHFTIIEPGRPLERVIDVSFSDSRLDAVAIKSFQDRNEVRAALDKLSREKFRGGPLREVYFYSWRSIYYAGPLVALLALVALLCPAISILFRKLRPKIAIGVLAAGGLVATGALALMAEGVAGLGGDPSSETIAAGLGHASPVVRHDAAFQAFQRPHPTLANPLLKAADDGDLRVRLWAVAALGNTKDPRALDRLVARLDDPEIFVRYRAAEGLGLLGDPRAEAPLLRMMRERSWYEGLYALRSLRLIFPGKY